MAVFEKVCEWCDLPFQTSTKRTRFCSDAHRKEAFRESQQDMTAYDDVQTEMPEGNQPLSGRGCRAKGGRGEREVCHLIAGITGDDVSRNIAQSRDGGHDIDWGPFALEVKTQQNLSMPAWQRQVEKSVEGTSKVPCVVWRRKAEDWWIALPMRQFVEIFNMLRRAAEAKQNE